MRNVIKEWKYETKVILGLIALVIFFSWYVLFEPSNIVLITFKNWFNSFFWCCIYFGIFYRGLDWYRNYDIVEINFIELPPKFAGGVVIFFAFNLMIYNFSMFDIINIPIFVLLFYLAERKK